MPGGPQFSVQYNNPLGTFAGDPNFTWTPGTGMQVKGAEAIGTYTGLTVPNAQFNPGSTTHTFSLGSASLVVNDRFSGDMSGLNLFSQVVAPGVNHTGASNAFYEAIRVDVAVNTQSSGPFGTIAGIFGNASNYGSGNVNLLAGLYYDTVQLSSGTASIVSTITAATEIYSAATTASLIRTESGNPVQGTVGSFYGFQANAPAVSGGGSIANLNGLRIEDHSGIGGTTSHNILSRGASSVNVFEGFTTTGSTTIGGLPAAAAGNKGWRYFVTDSAAAPTFGATLTAGGSFFVPVYSDGTNWRYG